MEFKAREIAEILNGTVEGNPEAIVTTFARIESGKPGAICFFANPKYEHYVYKCKADVIIVNKTFEPKEPVSATMIRVDDSYAAVAALLDYVTARKRSYKRHRGCRSRVRWSAKLGKKVYVGDFAYIGRKAVIGDCTKIYESAYIGDDVKIGSYCTIYPGVRIYPGMVIGDRVTIHANAVIGADGFGFAPLEDGTWKKIEHTGNVIIEDDVEIGANTCIDRAKTDSTIIRHGVKLDNLIQIGHNVEIGANTVSSAQTGIAGTSKVGHNCFLAGQVGIADHVTVGNMVKIGSKSGIDKDVPDGEIRFGYPALAGMQYHRSFAVFKTLPELRMRIDALERKLDKEE
jgi:UDP-3-O-[3-hydroxymyristoyl] glucosamine N-acyltransferase